MTCFIKHVLTFFIICNTVKAMLIVLKSLIDFDLWNAADNAR